MNKLTLSIESIDNGYVVTFDNKRRIHFSSPLELSRKILAYFEINDAKEELSDEVKK